MDLSVFMQLQPLAQHWVMAGGGILCKTALPRGAGQMWGLQVLALGFLGTKGKASPCQGKYKQGLPSSGHAVPSHQDGCTFGKWAVF